MNAFDKIAQAIDWFIPANHREPEFTLRRARIVVVTSIVITVLALPFAAVYCVAARSPLAVWASILAVLMCGHVPLTLRYSRSLALAGNCFVLNAFLIVSYLSWLAGGQGAPPLVWTVALPMFAVAMVGRRCGLLWTSIVLLTVAGFYMFDQFGIRPPQQFGANRLKLLSFVTLSGLVLLILSITLLYESNQDRSGQLLKVSNDRLAETSARLQAVVDNAPDGIMTMDLKGTITSFNQAAEALFQYRANEVIGHSLNMLMPLSAAGQGERSFIGGMKEDVRGAACTRQRVIGRRKNNELFPLSVAAGMTYIEGRRFLTCILRDVTELAAAEERQQQFVQLIEHGSDFVAMAGPDGAALSYLNSAGRRMVGIDLETSVNSTGLEAYLTPQSWRRIAAKALPEVHAHGSWEGDGELQHWRTGAAINVHLNMVLLRSPQGRDTLCVEAVPVEQPAVVG